MPSQSVQKLFNLEEKNKSIYFIISVVAHSDLITISRLDGQSKFQIFPAAIFNGLEYLWVLYFAQNNSTNIST